jgi:hypothetical protein
MVLATALGLSTTAFAASSVRVRLDDSSIRVDEDTYAYVSTSVDYDEERWDTDDSHIVEIDSDSGEITGLYPGRATIRVRLYEYRYDDDTGKERRASVGSGSATITVIGSGRYYDDDYWEDYWDDFDDESIDYTAGERTPVSSGSGSRTNTTLSNGALTASALNSAINGASGSSVTLKDYDSASASALRTAASKNGGMSFHFDTTNGGSVEGRLTLTAANAVNLENGLDLGVYTNQADTGEVANTFENTFKNDLVVAKSEQSGSFGTTVKIAIRAGSVISSHNDLRVYRYDSNTNKYSELKNANPWIDDNGYAHFYTTMGGYFIVSDGPLKR